MERTDKKNSAEAGKEANLLDKEQMDKVAGGHLYGDQCPVCDKRGCLIINYTQKTNANGVVIDYRIVDCSNSGYHREIPLGP